MKIKRCFKNFKKENITITILHYVGKFLDNMNGSMLLKDDICNFALLSFYIKLFIAKLQIRVKIKQLRLRQEYYKILEFEPKLKFDM